VKANANDPSFFAGERGPVVLIRVRTEARIQAGCQRTSAHGIDD
jgi:hypothetical protein